MDLNAKRVLVMSHYLKGKLNEKLAYFSFDGVKSLPWQLGLSQKEHISCIQNRQWEGEKNMWLIHCILRFLLPYLTHFEWTSYQKYVFHMAQVLRTWWYSERMLCISSTSSLEISFTTKVRSYDVSSSPMHCPSSSLSGGLRARDTCWGGGWLVSCYWINI